MEKFLEDSKEDQEDDVGQNLSTRIAKEVYKVSLRIEEDSKGLIAVAIGILNQAQAIVDKDSALALRLFNRARVISRK